MAAAAGPGASSPSRTVTKSSSTRTPRLSAGAVTASRSSAPVSGDSSTGRDSAWASAGSRLASANASARRPNTTVARPASSPARAAFFARQLEDVLQLVEDDDVAARPGAVVRAAEGEAPRAIVLVGPSGSGKSSLLAAGLSLAMAEGQPLAGFRTPSSASCAIAR